MSAVLNLIAITEEDLKQAGFPLSPWATRKRIRDGELKAVKLGRRYYVTPELLAEFVNSKVGTGGSR